MKHLKNQRGFAGFELLLIVVVVGIIGFAGYRYYQARITQPAEKTEVTEDSDTDTDSDSDAETETPAESNSGYVNNATTFVKVTQWDIKLRLRDVATATYILTTGADGPIESLDLSMLEGGKKCSLNLYVNRHTTEVPNSVKIGTYSYTVDGGDGNKCSKELHDRVQEDLKADNGLSAL